MERLSEVRDTWGLTLLDLADKLVAQYAAEPQVGHGGRTTSKLFGIKTRVRPP